MTRFFSIHWTPRSPECSESAALVRRRVLQHLPEWRTAFECDRFAVMCPERAVAAGDTLAVSHGNGLILGTIFPRPSNAVAHGLARTRTLGRHDAHSTMHTRGRTLVTDFWGSYVAFLADPERPSSHILRGPLSSIKCFHAKYEHISLFFSHLDDLADLRLFPLTVNWECIRAQAACADFIGRETAIKEVTSIEGGEAIEVVDNKITRRFYWHPCDIAETSDIGDFEAAVSRVRAATQMSVQSWAARYERIVHTLSGGLDSSISVACSRRSLPSDSLVCINYFTEEAIGDERHYARQVADYVGVGLIEVKREPSVNLDIFLRCAKTAWPMLDFSGYGQYRKEVDFTKQFQANAIFAGEFGDNVFEQGAGSDGAADYVWRFGVRPGLLSVALECGLRRNLSVWRVLRHAIASGMSRRNADYYRSHSYLERELRVPISDLTLLSEQALESVRAGASRFMHPWMDRIEGVPPGKFMMIYGLYAMGSHEPPFADPDDPPFVAPLGSQPLVEECLRVPSCFCIRDGLDRAVARSAFAGELPEAVLTRTTKGTPEAWTRDVLRRNQTFLKSFLLDGLLVSSGILDKKRVEAALSNEVTGSRVFVGDVVEQLYIEAWLRQWEGERSSVAA